MSVEEAARMLKIDPFQLRVHTWMIACFVDAIVYDRVERNHRFLEEALELVQAGGCTKAEAQQLVDYVYGRPVGMIAQEVGGVMVTLAAFCSAWGVDLGRCGDDELLRVWMKIDQIRAKQAGKPKFRPLPGPSAPPAGVDPRFTVEVALQEAARCRAYPSPRTLNEDAIVVLAAEVERLRAAGTPR